MTEPVSTTITELDIEQIAGAEGRVVVFCDDEGKLDKAGRRVSLAFDLYRPKKQAGSATKAKSGKEKEIRIDGLGNYYALVIGNSKHKYLPDLKITAAALLTSFSSQSSMQSSCI